jgi:hypothetical protein
MYFALSTTPLASASRSKRQTVKPSPDASCNLSPFSGLLVLVLSAFFFRRLICLDSNYPPTPPSLTRLFLCPAETGRIIVCFNSPWRMNERQLKSPP